jgi:ethanolaminephosphotransferase
LDSADGKQARKTNNSSPLGLMFDHGADIVNTVLLSISLSALVGIGHSWHFPLLYIILTTGFFFNTLEEYYSGSLNLPLLNAVSDGCVLIYAIGIITGLYGTQIWDTQTIFQLTLIELILYSLAAAGVVTIGMKYSLTLTLASSISISVEVSLLIL